ncbi:MAG: hypothetical protein ACLVBJ_10820 [Pilosibacter sp.]
MEHSKRWRGPEKRIDKHIAISAYEKSELEPIVKVSFDYSVGSMWSTAYRADGLKATGKAGREPAMNPLATEIF